MLDVFVAEAESEMQQKLGDLHSQVDTLQARLHEADADERMIQAKLDTAKHEVCAWQLSWSILYEISLLLMPLHKYLSYYYHEI